MLRVLLNWALPAILLLGVLHFMIVIATLQRALKFHIAGRPDLTVRLARIALTLGAYGPLRIGAYQTLGQGYISQGLLKEAEQARTTAYELAMKSGDKPQAAISLVQNASSLYRRGQCDEAISACYRAYDISDASHTRRLALTTLAVALRIQGRFDESRTTRLQVRDIPDGPNERNPGLSYAIASLMLADLEAEVGVPETALRYWQDAAPGFPLSKNVGLIGVAAGAWIQARLGNRAEAERIIAEVEARLPEFAQATEAQGDALLAMANAMFALGEFERCIGFRTRALELLPSPVSQVGGWFWIGECRLAVNDLAAARAAYEKATEFDLNIYHSRLAQQRLQQMAQPLT